MTRRLLLLALLAPATALAQHGGDDLPPMMRNPRMVSGQARGEQNDPPGRLTVRAVQGEMKRSEHGDVQAEFPKGAPVHLVAIDRRGQMTVTTVPLDDGGRAVFDNLATDGSVSYFALALFPRGDTVDRLQSRPVVLPPEVGLRMMLAGHAPDSGKPPADDVLGDDATEVPAAGEILVEVDGQTDGVRTVELIQLGRDQPVAEAPVEPATTIVRPQGRVSSPEADAALKDGLVAVAVRRQGKGVPGIRVEVVPSGSGPGSGAGALTTDADGRALFDAVPAGQQVVLRVAVHGQLLESPPFERPASGGTRLTVDVDWREMRSLRARFTGVPDAGGAVYAARIPGDQVHLSPPFQLTPARGVRTQILVFPHVFIGFHGGAEVDDERLGVQVQFTIINPSVVPFDPGPGGLRIPLPREFRGASVAEEMAARVKVDEQGLVWRGAIPPGQRQFIAGFFVPIVDGSTAIDLPLPHGAFDSQLVLEDIPGMRVTAPGLEQRPHKTDDGRRMLVLTNIQRRPGDALQLRIDGLPQHPAWTRWSKLLVGFGVVALFGWGIWGAAARARSGPSRGERLEAEREDLLQALVQLEADHRKKRIADAAYQKNRGVLTRKLEAIYGELGGVGDAAGGAEGDAPARRQG